MGPFCEEILATTAVGIVSLQLPCPNRLCTHGDVIGGGMDRMEARLCMLVATGSGGGGVGCMYVVRRLL